MAKNQMARRRQRAPRYSVPVVEQPAISPESGLRITLKQAIFAVAIILGAGGAYAALKYDQAEVRRDVTEIRRAQEAFTQATPAALREQDEKRTKLGDALVASNKVIADKVGDLATAIALQQANAKHTENALLKISEQLGALTRQPPPARGR